MFENLKERFIADRENDKQKTRFFIENGFCESWTEKQTNDNGIKRYSTATRWDQYTAGIISREKAVEYAVKRMEKAHDKQTAAGLDKLDRIAAAPDITSISINVIYKRSTVWGYNPTADVITENGTFSGYASGCGYDKESSAVASAFNKDNSILKVLYTIKENGLIAGLSDESKTACTGVDNRNICGYGSGYSVLPYFEGGVGVSCFWSILKKAGFETRCNYGKHENFYHIYKGV